MMFVVCHVLNRRSGKIEPILIPADRSTDELMRIVKSYSDLVRVSIELIINGRSFFKYNLKNPDDLQNIDFFKAHGCGTTTYNSKPQSVGFIDRKKGVRVEYMADGLRIYPIES